MNPGWSDPGFAALAAMVEARAGLTWSVARRDSAEAAIRRAMKQAKTRSLPDFVQLVKGDAVAFDELIAELTIGETYFFRDAEQFALIREEILPDLARAADGGQLRVWSAGCASGEEAYSLAIVLAEQRLLSRTRVLGTDIARNRLAAARRARYSRWSLRGVSPAMVERWFREDGRRWELDEAVRESAEFRYLNLAEDRYPSLASGVWAMDLVLCRNVLIYFDRDTVARVARRLLSSLSDRGWLLLGAADPPIAEFAECEVVVTDAGIAYRRASAGESGDVRRLDTRRAAPPAEPAPVEAPETQAAVPEAGQVARDASVDHAVAEEEAPSRPAPVPARDAASWPDAATATDRPSVEEIAAAYRERDYERVIELAAEAAGGAPAMDETVRILHVRALANLGRLPAASRICVAALETHPASAELTYLHAVLLSEAEHAREAATAAKQALYLDRTLVVAHIALADAAARLGDGGTARRSLRNAGRLLEAMRADAQVPASDGEMAGRLAELVRTRLRLMEAA